MIKQKDNYIYIINGNEYDIRNVDDELYIMQEIEKEKNKNEIQKVFQEFTDKKVGLMAIPLFPKALQNADYVVLTTLLDEKFSNYDVVNKPNYRIINRQSYLKNKEEMLKSTGNLEKVLYTEEKSKKALSKSQWDKSFKKLRELGIVEEIKNNENKIYEYHIYNKSLEGKEYTMVECELLRRLKMCYKSIGVKLYSYLRKQCYNHKTKQFEIKHIPLEQICIDLGMSKNSRHDIFLILCELKASRYIEIYEVPKKSIKGNYNILYYEYEILPYDTWLQARKPIKK